MCACSVLFLSNFWRAGSDAESKNTLQLETSLQIPEAHFSTLVGSASNLPQVKLSELLAATTAAQKTLKQAKAMAKQAHAASGEFCYSLPRAYAVSKVLTSNLKSNLCCTEHAPTGATETLIELITWCRLQARSGQNCPRRRARSYAAVNFHCYGIPSRCTSVQSGPEEDEGMCAKVQITGPVR